MRGGKREPIANKSDIAEAPLPASFDPSFLKTVAIPSKPLQAHLLAPEEQHPAASPITRSRLLWNS